jgi:voltage-gated potassium channel
VDERSERIAKRFEWPMVVAALLVIPLVAIEQSDLEQPWDTIADVLNRGTWLAFATEFVVMMVIVPQRWVWIRKNPLDAIVVFLTPPFIGAFAGVRLFRLLRLLRLLKVVPLLRGMLSLEGVKYAALITLATVVAGGAAFASIEKGQGLSTWDGIYWAGTTMTTIGSDIQPDTTGGRVLAIGIVIVGLSFVSFLTAFIADRFVHKEVQADVKTHEEHVLERLDHIASRLDRVEQQIGEQRG